MAAALRLAGTSVVSVRLPSVALGTLTVLAVYGLASIAVGRRVAWIAAALAATSRYSLELVSGAFPTDHVDVAFAFFVTASLLALLLRLRSAHVVWTCATGLLVGAAILTKWLPGGLALACWLAAIVLGRRERAAAELAHLGLAVGVALAIFAPWEIYIRVRFPLESAAERGYSVLHLSQPVEGHSGGAAWHFWSIATLYGRAAPWVVVPALAALWHRARAREARIVLLGSLALVYGFFSLAATKMAAYPLIACSAIYTAFGSAVDVVGAWITSRWSGAGRDAFTALAGAALAVASMSLPAMAARHDNRWPSADRAAKAHNEAVFEATRAGVGPSPGQSRRFRWGSRARGRAVRSARGAPAARPGRSPAARRSRARRVRSPCS